MLNMYEELKNLELFIQTEISRKLYGELLAQYLRYPYFVVDKKMIVKYYETRNKYYVYAFSSYVSVINKIVDKDTDETSVKLSFLRNKTIDTKIFSTSIFSKQGVSILLKFDVSFDVKYDRDLSIYLMKSYTDAKIIYEYQQLGWVYKEQNPICFKSYRKIKKKTTVRNCVYNGIMELKHYGDYDLWLQMVKKEVIGNTPLEFVLILGFASPILSLLNEKYDLGSIIFNLSNSSSKGKTTAAMLASSVFSNPAINKGTLISYNATDNALIELISKCNGITLALDEAAMSNAKSFSSLLYKICSGTSKYRLNGDSTLKGIKHFSSVIISTAEYNILQDNSPEGLRARIFELDDVFTSSAKNSEKIKSVILNNYGYAGNYFIQYLLDVGYEAILKKYEELKTNLSDLIEKNNNLYERIISKLSLILLTANLCNEYFPFHFNIKRLKKYIVALTQRINETTEDRLLEIIKDDVFLNAHKYIQNGDPLFGTSATPCGTIDDIENSTIITINRTEFKKIMNFHNVDNYTTFLKVMKDKRVLITEKDRLTVRDDFKKTLNQKVTCYRFKIPNDNLNHRLTKNVQSE